MTGEPCRFAAYESRLKQALGGRLGRAEPVRERRCLAAACHVELADDVRDVDARGLGADEQLGGSALAAAEPTSATRRRAPGCIAATFSQRRRAQDIVSGHASHSDAGCLRGTDARPGAGSPRRALLPRARRLARRGVPGAAAETARRLRGRPPCSGAPPSARSATGQHRLLGRHQHDVDVRRSVQRDGRTAVAPRGPLPAPPPRQGEPGHDRHRRQRHRGRLRDRAGGHAGVRSFCAGDDRRERREDRPRTARGRRPPHGDRCDELLRPRAGAVAAAVIARAGPPDRVDRGLPEPHARARFRE